MIYLRILNTDFNLVLARNNNKGAPMKEACLIVSCFITEATQMYYSIQNESHDHYLESTQLNI